MSSAASSLRLRPPEQTDQARLWAMAGSMTLLALVLVCEKPVAGVDPELWWQAAAALRLSVEAAAVLVASRRSSLPARLRGALVLLGAVSVISSVHSLWMGLERLPTIPELPIALNRAWSFASYGLLIPVVLMMPMAPFRRGEWPAFLLDVIVSVGGFVSIVWFLRAGLVVAARPSDWYADNTILGLIGGAAILTSLNLLALRRRSIPGRRAFWLLLAGLSSYLPLSLLLCIDATSPIVLAWADVFYFLGVIPTVWAAWAMRTDPIAAVAGEAHPHWLRSFNPFAIVMPAAVSAALLLVLGRGPASAVWPLAVTVAVLSALLVLRLVFTIRENDRRLRAIAEREVRDPLERLEALRRVAGGVAHVYNDFLTAVLGHAELGRASSDSPETRRTFEHIRDSAGRSAELTQHLLWFTGRQYQQRERLSVSAWLGALEPEIRALAGSDIRVDVRCDANQAWIDIDFEQLHDVMLELARNAINAMPEGGRLEVSASLVTEAPVRIRLPGSSSQVDVVVRDTGHGIPAADLPHVFEPFYSSRGLADANGLGLAIAHGVVRAHRGTISLHSEPGAGTEVHIRLPEAERG